MTWTVELTVGDHEQNGLIQLARWRFPNEQKARNFIAAENALIADDAEPDPNTEPFTFILDLREGGPCNDLIDNSRCLPMQSAMRLAPDQVRIWLNERPEPDSVIDHPIPLLTCEI